MNIKIFCSRRSDNKMTRVALKNRKVILSSLEQFGFFDMGEEYVYYAMLAAGSFRMELHVNRKGEVSSAVFDRETEERIYPEANKQ